MNLGYNDTDDAHKLIVISKLCLYRETAFLRTWALLELTTLSFYQTSLVLGLGLKLSTSEITVTEYFLTETGLAPTKKSLALQF